MPGFDGYELWHNENGSITFQCTPTLPGNYKITVEHDGTPLNGLPVCCVVQVAGDGFVTAYKAGQEADLDIELPENAPTQALANNIPNENAPEMVEDGQAGESSFVLQEMQPELAPQDHDDDYDDEDDEAEPASLEDLPVEVLPKDEPPEELHARVQLVQESGQEEGDQEVIYLQSTEAKQEVADPTEMATDPSQMTSEMTADPAEMIADTSEAVDPIEAALDPTEAASDQTEATTVPNQMIVVQGEQQASEAEMQDPLGGAVAMEITDGELPDEIVDIKPIVDLGMELPGGGKFILEKAPVDPNAPDMGAPIYILKEQGSEMTMLLDQGQGTLQEQAGSIHVAQDGVSVVQALFSEPVTELATQTAIGYPQADMTTEQYAEPIRTRSASRPKLIKPYQMVTTDIATIPKDVLNPELKKVDKPIRIGPGQNTKATLIRNMRRIPRLDIDEDGIPASNALPEINRNEEKFIAVPVEGPEEMVTKDATVAELNNLFQSLAETSADVSEAQNNMDVQEDNLPNIKKEPEPEKEPAAESEEAGATSNDTDAEEQLEIVSVQSPTLRRVSERAKKVFQCRKTSCGQLFNNRKELDEHVCSSTPAKENPFVCPDLKCKKMFNARRNFLNHMKNVHQEQTSDKPVGAACIIKNCNEKFNTHDEMKNHVENDHTAAEKRYMCKICLRMCATRTILKQHEATHSEVTYKCKEEGCKKEFKTSKLLEMHTEKHAKGLWCATCAKSFLSEENFRRHIRNIHERPIKPEYERDEQGRFLCPQCRKAVSTKQILHKHIENVHGDQRFACPICNGTCKTKENLKRHLKTHDDVKRFMCDTCGQFFKTKDILRCHVSQMHNVEESWEVAPGSDTPVLVERPARPFVCKYCDRSFKRKAVLKEHLAIHESDLDVPCSQPGCNKTFPTRTLMKTHIRAVHRFGMQRLACPHEDCTKVFKSQSALRVHINSIHMNVRFQCIADGCQHSFTTKHHMLSHFQLKHTTLDFNYACSICDKRFRLKEQVKAHLDVHKQERAYECEQCSKTFTTKSRLTAHAKIHINHSEHICYHCGKGFLRKYRLKEHLAKHEHPDVSVAYTVV